MVLGVCCGAQPVVQVDFHATVAEHEATARGPARLPAVHFRAVVLHATPLAPGALGVPEGRANEKLKEVNGKEVFEKALHIKTIGNER